MPPAVVPVEDGVAVTVAGAGTGTGVVEKEARHGCHVAWLAWWAHVRCVLASTVLLPCHAALGLAAPVSSTVRGTLFAPSTGDRRVRLFLQEHTTGTHNNATAEVDEDQLLVLLDLPAGLGGADIAVAGRLVLERQVQWAPDHDTGSALLDAPRWLVYCNGRRAGYAARRGRPSEAERWVLEKLRNVTAGAGRLPGGGEYLRGWFERVVGSPDAESFHLVEPIGWMGVNSCGGGCDGGLSIFFHRI